MEEQTSAQKLNLSGVYIDNGSDALISSSKSLSLTESWLNSGLKLLNFMFPFD